MIPLFICRLRQLLRSSILSRYSRLRYTIEVPICSSMSKMIFINACYYIFLFHLSLSLPASNSTMETLIEYRPGDTNLILSVPHGGSVKLDEIPDRSKCCNKESRENCFNTTDGHRCMVTLHPDAGTIAIANVIEEILTSKGKKPHILINHLHRIKLDVNRNIDEAAQGNPLATEIYNMYHSKLDEIKEKVQTGLLLDIHGQSHKHNLTELGYLRIREQLNSQDYNATNSSIRHLSVMSGLSGEELIIGPDSLGAQIEKRGFGVIPSPSNPFPGIRAYYAGGHITRRHGSREKGEIDCIQIEMPLIVRKKESPLKESFVHIISESIYDFHETFYTKKNDSSPCCQEVQNE